VLLTKYSKLDLSVARAMTRCAWADQLRPADIQVYLDIAVKYGASRARLRHEPHLQPLRLTRNPPALQRKRAHDRCAALPSIDLDALLVDEPARGAFHVRKDVFTDPAVFDLELTRIFEGTWIFIDSRVRRLHRMISSPSRSVANRCSSAAAATTRYAASITVVATAEH